MVVTPNRRLARFLHRDFDLAQREHGLTAWPTPSILPYPQWLEALWAEAVAAGAMTDAALLLTPATAMMFICAAPSRTARAATYSGES